ncbi:MAG: alanine--glyoxylate aminotransferase family protein, partial [bacterium]|nr:alanine--glyoxylate aminotransferase family protein [bacterium]
MKKRLFTPGPISVPEDVLLEMAKPIIHHRTPEFLAIAQKTVENLKYFFQTHND